jgi:peptide chain release factor 2
LGGLFDVQEKENKIKELEARMNEPGFWDNLDKATSINKELATLKKEITLYNDINKQLKDNSEVIELLELEYSEDLSNELESELNKLQKDIDELEINTLFTNEYDTSDCYLEIHPGAGGTESCDWASMLLRMYERFCDKFGFTHEVIEYQPGEEAGVKSVTLHIKGEYAFGYLKNEKGVHRLVRISPFDSNARRHTSFASVLVIPEINQEINIEIKEEDIRIDTYCASGHGGQGVNTTPSAVRITHFPSKIVVTCQNERSQIQNKAQAMQVLKSKLFQIEQEKKQEELNKLKGITNKIDFGSQIRSYVLEPYTLVKDYRSNYETSEASKILDGDLQELIESILKTK